MNFVVIENFIRNNSISQKSTFLKQKSGPFLHNSETIGDLDESEWNYEYPMILRYNFADQQGTHRLCARH